MDRVRTAFSDWNVVPGSTKYVDTGTYLGKITVTTMPPYSVIG